MVSHSPPHGVGESEASAARLAGHVHDGLLIERELGVAPIVDHADCVATWNVDSGDDGSVDATYTDEYDAGGDLAVTRYSSGARIDYSYDAVTGALTGYTYDFDGDGIAGYPDSQ